MSNARRPFDPAASYVWRCAVTYAAVQMNAGDPVDPDVVPWGKRRDLFIARRIILAPVVESAWDAIAERADLFKDVTFTVEEWKVKETTPKLKVTRKPRKKAKKKAKKKVDSMASQLANLPPARDK